MRTFLAGLLLLCVGVGTGALLIIGWGGGRSAPGPDAASGPALKAEIGTGSGAAAPAPAMIPRVEGRSAPVPAGPQVSGAQHIVVVGTPPVPPTPSAATANQPKFQPNGLPIGVVKDAYNPEVYKKLPGVQPPTINYDGRDMSAEALSMVQTHREPVPMPGLPARQQSPANPAQPLPFPKTMEEINAAGLNGPVTPGAGQR